MTCTEGLSSVLWSQGTCKVLAGVREGNIQSYKTVQTRGNPSWQWLIFPQNDHFLQKWTIWSQWFWGEKKNLTNSLCELPYWVIFRQVALSERGRRCMLTLSNQGCLQVPYLQLNILLKLLISVPHELRVNSVKINFPMLILWRNKILKKLFPMLMPLKLSV